MKTDSTVGSIEEVKVRFVSEQDPPAGFSIRFYPTSSYLIEECTSDWTNFPTCTDVENVKYWRITLKRTAGRNGIFGMGSQFLANQEPDSKLFSSFSLVKICDLSSKIPLLIKTINIEGNAKL